MPLLRLNDEQVSHFAKVPETAMDVHAVKSAKTEEVNFVLGCLILLVPDGEAAEQISGLLRASWFRPRRTRSDDEGSFEGWLRSLGEAPPDLTAGFILGPYGTLPPPPPPPPLIIYGHLPFSGTTEANDVHYRCESWPTSIRIDLQNNKVLAGTFGFPASELPFVPTGFAAVGRYALPNLPPACRRYELQPPDGTLVNCGASVPLNGQSGGGVEVLFPNDFNNRGAIANPVILPVM